ncbi:hypothetical protein ACFYZN_36845 [Streptomyces sp. NPDC001777]|uniref:hypothetical protein n=1 Tax=Streptomyces sp. NPDC001777 TaxID=3364608 RepID=UPI0036B5498E
MAEGLSGAKDAVSRGFTPVPGRAPEGLGPTIVGGKRRAFMNGVHTSAPVSGVPAVVGALVAAVRVRRGPEAARR